MHRAVTGVAALIALIAGLVAGPTFARAAELRACSDPDNLPFSNARREGFENRIAEVVGRELGEGRLCLAAAASRVPARGAECGLCDLVVGTPRLDGLLATRPYYRSTYVFVSRAEDGLDVRRMTDSRLRDLRIGVHLIGDDGWNTPPAHALAGLGITGNVTGYSLLGDYAEADPPARLIEAVARGEVDIAIAWGPLAGVFAQRSPVPLRLEPVEGRADFIPLVFEYPSGRARRGWPVGQASQELRQRPLRRP